MRIVLLACFTLLVGVPLRGQLQFLNAAAPWIVSPPVVTTDSAGNTYVVSNSAGNGFGPNLKGLTATKLDVAHRTVYSFSFAPTVAEVRATSAAVDSQGELIIGGWTYSPSFPVVNALFYPRLPVTQLNQRGFLLKIDAGGSRLLFATLVGGNELDYHYVTQVSAVAVDTAGAIYAAGTTSSPTLPVSGNAFQKTGGLPAQSGFVMKISNGGDALIYSTYLGGSGVTNPHALVVDGQGAATVAGVSMEKDFPVTVGAYGAVSDRSIPNVFVTRVTGDGSGLLWSALLPGDTFDYEAASSYGSVIADRWISVAVDPQGNATVGLTTTNRALPVSAGALQAADLVPAGSVRATTGFLATFSNDGKTLLHSTYFGGANGSTLRGLAVDGEGNFWVSGETMLQLAPLPGFPPQASPANLPKPAGSLNLGDGYVAEMDASLTRVLRYYGMPNGTAGATLNLLPNRDVVVSGTSNAVLTVPASGPQQPVVWGAAGAAEQAVTPYIAPGELISLYGVQLGPEPAVSASIDATGKIATELAGYRVLVNGIAAPLLYAGGNQVNLVVPFGIAKESDASIQVITPSGASQMVSGFSVTASEPQVFPVMLNEDGSINSESNPARIGSVVTVWATGGGAMDSGMVDGAISQAPLGKPLLPVSVRFSRLSPANEGEVTYAGAAPGMVAGVLQINFRITPGITGHGVCYGRCPVVLTIGDRTSLAPFVMSVWSPPDPVLWMSN